MFRNFIIGGLVILAVFLEYIKIYHSESEQIENDRPRSRREFIRSAEDRRKHMLIAAVCTVTVGIMVGCIADLLMDPDNDDTEGSTTAVSIITNTTPNTNSTTLSTESNTIASNPVKEDVIKSTYLANMSPMTNHDVAIFLRGDKYYQTTNTGEDVMNCFRAGYWSGEAYIVYFLEGQYNTLSGKAAVMQDDVDYEHRDYFDIYGDEELIYSSPNLSPEDVPVDFEIDIKDIQKLKVVFNHSGIGACNLKVSP